MRSSPDDIPASAEDASAVPKHGGWAQIGEKVAFLRKPRMAFSGRISRGSVSYRAATPTEQDCVGLEPISMSQVATDGRARRRPRRQRCAVSVSILSPVEAQHV